MDILFGVSVIAVCFNFNCIADENVQKLVNDSERIKQQYAAKAKALLHISENNKKQYEQEAEQLEKEKQEILAMQKSCASCKNNANDISSSESTFLVFGSSNLSSLKQLAQDAQKIGGVVVLRGLIENSFKKTAQFLMNQGTSVVVDPTLFQKFNVKVVPTFVVANNSSYDILKGNVSVEFALSEFAKNGDLKNLSEEMLNKLRNK